MKLSQTLPYFVFTSCMLAALLIKRRRLTPIPQLRRLWYTITDVHACYTKFHPDAIVERELYA